MRQAHRTERWSRLRTLVAEAGHVLLPTVYSEIRQAFADWASDPAHPQHPGPLTRERSQSEFLISVDRTGTPVPLTKEAIEDFEQTASRYPDFKNWFRPSILSEGKHPTLFVARWLCHLLGFRHQAVHLFIDHPTLDNYTLVQVRGAHKAQYPGCFGVPAAGHIVEFTPVMDSLLKELREELNLTHHDIHELKKIGSYDHEDVVGQQCVYNVEFRIVFRGTLKEDGLLKARFADGEVAALAVFALSELEALIEAFPERVSSGLMASLPVYLRSRKRRQT
jgi:8-oxo-dGTP pyrophosphatase MutT (NUDIX family)